MLGVSGVQAKTKLYLLLILSDFVLITFMLCLFQENFVSQNYGNFMAM